MHVSFICTGNICRSPMAALIFSEELRRAGLDSQVRVSSAGTGPWHVGEPADPRTEKVLAANDYPTDHVAAQVDERHLSADLLVAMDESHLRAVRRLADDPDKVRLLRSFDPDADGTEVPDPYYGGPNGFEEVLAMVEAAMPGLLAHVREQL
ncbi:low molecular weight phosphotyrosine protein phosphatase [Saccharopolyspora rhizosphaerae]|uniref:protein-tyrosine-phosphatase n=1 Tax=Saccharopolyspora rhizosphaerae TaxID=2492662 RepID=A0A426K1C6_9PSEU|nr:low molecular weight protein-tyrosine-phosphatase [Saccharopolyspora rhizosphaerae]RRO19208.1 low molecular weight phosphotyrosine protein phosphatase [Saccharopolyspora rhizosphaerae]